MCNKFSFQQPEIDVNSAFEGKFAFFVSRLVALRKLVKTESDFIVRSFETGLGR